MTDLPVPLRHELRAELRTLARLALPISLAQSGLVAMTLVDIAIVGRVSVQDLAAVSMGRSIAYTMSAVGFGVAAALDPLAAQAIGAGHPGRAWAALRATLRACALVSIFVVVAAFAATTALVPMGVDPALVPRVQLYIAGQIPSLFLFPAFLAGKNFLQCFGETRPALIAMLVSNAVNFVVCNLLVRGDDALRWAGLPLLGLPRLGTFGAGLSVSVGSAVLASIVLMAAAQRREPEAAAAPIRLAAIYRLGLPLGLQMLAETSVFGSLALLAGRLGATVVSAHQVALSLASFTFMGALGVGGATAVRVGHAVGAGLSPRRAGVLGILLGAAIMGGSAVLFTAIPRLLIGAFTPDATVIAIGVPLLGIAAVFQLFDGVQAVAAGALRGAGDVRFPFLANLAAHWLLGLPLAVGLAFGLDLGVRGLWLGLTVGLVAIAVLLTSRFLRLTRGIVARVDPS